MVVAVLVRGHRDGDEFFARHTQATQYAHIRANFNELDERFTSVESKS